MPRVQSGAVLLQGTRCAAHGRARESVQGADSDLRSPDVQEASRCRCQMSPMQGGDILQQEAQGEARVGAREQVRGAVLLQVKRFVYVKRDLDTVRLDFSKVVGREENEVMSNRLRVGYVVLQNLCECTLFSKPFACVFVI